MQESKNEGYSLYQTFSQNIPSEKLSAAEKKYIIKERSKFTRPQEIAFVRLILEHYRLENITHKDLELTKLPYDGYEENSKIVFDLSNKSMSKDLLWILYRFTKMCVEEENV